MFKTTYLAILGFALGLSTMATQLVINIIEKITEGEPAIYGAVHFFGYLTNISNIWIVLIYASFLFDAKWLRRFSSANMRGSALALIVLVSFFYHFILRPTFVPPEGLDLALDLSKHYLAGLLFVVWWIVAHEHGKLTLRNLPMLTLPGLLYPTYVFGRGALINQYPYKVIDASLVGYPSALTYAVIVIIGFAALCALVIIADRAVNWSTNRVEV